MRTLISVIVVMGLIAAAFWGSYRFFRADELEEASARLSLYRSTVVAELERFSHMTFVLANDPFVFETAKGGDTITLNDRFRAFAEKAGIDAIYLMDKDGITRAASNANTERSFVGQDYSFRPYFQTALNREQGQFYGIGATTGIPGYFYAEPVVDRDEEILGVVAIKIDLAALQESWSEAGEQVVLANADGISLLSSNPDWRYRSLAPLDDDQLREIEQSRQFGTQSLERLDWRVSGSSARFGSTDWLYLTTDDLPNNWSLHYFASDDRAVTRSWLVAGVVLVLSGLTFIGLQLQRTKRIGRALIKSEAEEASLRNANERLAIEIEDRKTAERQLKKTQSELERAGRLAALGRLSSSVTHELGQPITAMRNHLAVAELKGGEGAANEKLKSLVDRMEGITRQLKFFSRKGRDSFETFDMRDAHVAALELFEDPNGTLTANVSTQPLLIHGNRLRIEQVMTNLLKNALDAVEGCQNPQIEIDLQQRQNDVIYSITDNGHGLGNQTLDDLREPFRTSRESGQGMGLGLTISAGILDDHGGRLEATDLPEGGARFTASLPALEHGDLKE